MKRLNYDEIKEIFNKKIFENSKKDLIQKIAENPNRYIGIFRPTTAKTKIIQNMTQSHEIKFGDAFEILIRRVFETYSYKSLERKIKIDNSYLDLDQLFEFENRIIFIEQKVRDDHDSTKKRGQISNFENKINSLLEKYDKKLSCYFYFIDPDLNKNRNYYIEELSNISNAYKLDVNLVYGEELFKKEKLDNVWEEEIVSFLKEWRNELLDFPEINFDMDYFDTFEEIKTLKPLYFRKIFQNEEVVNTIFPIIFPQGKVLKLLKDYFYEKSQNKNRNKKIYEYLYLYLENFLKETSL